MRGCIFERMICQLTVSYIKIALLLCDKNKKNSMIAAGLSLLLEFRGLLYYRRYFGFEKRLKIFGQKKKTFRKIAIFTKRPICHYSTIFARKVKISFEFLSTCAAL